MKQLFFVTLILLSELVQAQVKEPSAEVTIDFCRNMYIQVKIYNNDNIRASCYMAGRKLGYQLSDIEEAVENINKNKKFRDELQKQMAEMYRDKEMITLNLIGIGMRATNAKILASYLVYKYVGGSYYNSISNEKGISKTDFHLPEPKQVLKMSYKAVIDSLNKNKADYKIDSTFGEGLFYGYSLRTNDGEYFLTDKHEIRTYEFQVNQSIEEVKGYLIKNGAIITKKGTIHFDDGKGYYMISYKGYWLEINKTGENQSRIVYEIK